MVVPFGAGGPTDALARIVAERMRGALGQTVLVENVTGASGTIGVGRVARAAPDGYTMVLGNWPSLVVTSAIYTTCPTTCSQRLRADRAAPEQSLHRRQQEGPAGEGPEGADRLASRPIPARSPPAPAAPASGQHVSGVYFQKVTGTSFTFVPYRAGSADVMRDLTAGHIDLIFDQAISALPFVRSGQVRAYAITGKTRLASAPDIPTVDEAGAPGVYISTWFGLWAPKGTPAEAVGKLSAAALEALADPAVQKRLSDLGQEIPPAGPAGRRRRSPRISRPRWTSGRRSSRTRTSRWIRRACRLISIIRNARLSDRAGEPLDIGIANGRIAAIERGIVADAPVYDARGCLACPGLIETHIHLDKSRIIDRCAPQPRASLSPVKGVTPLKKDMTVEDVHARAAATLEQCILHGTTRMRTQVEVDPGIGMRGFEGVRVADRRLQMGDRHRDLRVSAGRADQLSRHRRAAGRRRCKRGAKVLGGAPRYDTDEAGADPSASSSWRASSTSTSTCISTSATRRMR